MHEHIFTRSDRASPHVRSYCRTFTSKSSSDPPHIAHESLRAFQGTKQSPFRRSPARTVPQVCASSAVLRHRRRVPTSAVLNLPGAKPTCSTIVSRDLLVSSRQGCVCERRLCQHIVLYHGLFERVCQQLQRSQGTWTSTVSSCPMYHRSSSTSRASACPPRLRSSQSTIVIPSRVPAEPPSASLSPTVPVPVKTCQNMKQMERNACTKNVTCEDVTMHNVNV